MSLKTQKLKSGYGATFHRIYSVKITAEAEQIVAALLAVKSDLNQFSPQLLARFEKIKGISDELKNNDEYLIHITGPWDGPVRVSEVSQDSFRLVTLDGHLEAGEICFQIKSTETNQYTFEIESLARSRDAIVDFVYDKIPIAKLAQTEMWTQYCLNFAKHVLKNETDEKIELPEVHVLTEKFDQETGQWQKL